MTGAPHDDTARLASVLEWREPVTAGRLVRAAAGSAAVHLFAFLIYLITPSPRTMYVDPFVVTTDVADATPLYLPKSLQLTQTDPNETQQVSQELDILSALPSTPSVRDFRPPALPGPVTPEVPTELDALPELHASVATPVPDAPGLIPGMPVPVEKPKVILESLSPAAENPTPPENPAINTPRASVQDAIRNAKAGGGGGGGVPSNGAEIQPSPSPEMQLLSDPEGVDFKPYLLQVLASVRQNWFAVIPDVARTGRPGQTLIQFIIDREGGVPKLVIARPSGTLAFDQAAVASISASYPFPPLPADYGGSEIRLQLAFTYNLPLRR